MEDAKYTELAAKYLSGEINSTERRELMEWVAQSDTNQAFFDEMIHLWSLAGDAEKVFEANTTAAWSKVATRIGTPAGRNERESGSRGASLRTLSIKRDLLRIAAVILPLLAVGLWWLLQPKAPEERLIASEESQVEVLLPDGSQVTLNANSELRYFEAFSERKVTLVGEAFFEVAEDTIRPFEIFSDQTVTRVLGTSFNVRAYPDENKVEVMVQTGRVEFRERAEATERIILTADKAAVFKKDEKKIEETASLGTNAIAWKKKEIDVENEPLREVIKIINNYFRTEVIVENPAALECDVTVQRYADPTLEGVLELVAFPLSMEIDSTGGQIVLRGGEGCLK